MLLISYKRKSIVWTEEDVYAVLSGVASVIGYILKAI